MMTPAGTGKGKKRGGREGYEQSAGCKKIDGNPREGGFLFGVSNEGCSQNRTERSTARLSLCIDEGGGKKEGDVEEKFVRDIVVRKQIVRKHRGLGPSPGRASIGLGGNGC